MFVFGAIASPVFCAAPFPGEVVRLARAAGASFVCCRPSSRSFSRWVCVAFFPYRAAAQGFAVPVAGLFPASEFSRAPFCACRPSVRSFSRWVCVVFFRSRAAASSFAVPVAGLLSGSEFSCGSGFCLVRSSGGWFRVSVPVAVEAFE